MQKNQKTILVTRFSAFGDVIMSVRLIRLLVTQNSDWHFVFITKKPFAFLFEDIPNLRVFTPDIKQDYKGLPGLWQLSRKMIGMQPDAYADIHNVLRTKILRLFMSFSGVKKKTLRKGRLNKYRLTRKNIKMFKPLKNSVERYADVFRNLGLRVNLDELSNGRTFSVSSKINDFLKYSSRPFLIGIAPFSLHRQKIYPPDLMRELVRLLSADGYGILVFGGGENEQKAADDLISKIENTHNIIGCFSMKEELALMSKMDLMLCMDSANMHLASLTHTPILTVWGGTHPFAGFAPYKRPDYYEIQIPHSELACRPCSVYGKKTCRRGDWACMTRILPEKIRERISQMISDHTK